MDTTAEIHTAAESRDALLAELRQFVSDAEHLLEATAGQVGAEAGEARARIKDRLRITKARVLQLQAAALAQAREAGRATDAYVHDKPWQAIGIAAGVGLLLGVVIGRR
ncbi:MAG: YqjD family protein [Leptothrix sp. (in: b-proteobacteria)]